MLEEEIEHHKLRGVTPEQFKEIETTFKQFDDDNSGFIDRKVKYCGIFTEISQELKACLYSLGEEKNKTEIEEIMKKYGNKDGKGIIFEKFREFMIDVLGVRYYIFEFD